jgi:hypothetical protein
MSYGLEPRGMLGKPRSQYCCRENRESCIRLLLWTVNRARFDRHFYVSSVELPILQFDKAQKATNHENITHHFVYDCYYSQGVS